MNICKKLFVSSAQGIGSLKFRPPFVSAVIYSFSAKDFISEREKEIFLDYNKLFVILKYVSF